MSGDCDTEPVPAEREQIYETLMSDEHAFFENRRRWLREQDLRELYDEDAPVFTELLDSIDRFWDHVRRALRSDV